MERRFRFEALEDRGGLKMQILGPLNAAQGRTSLEVNLQKPIRLAGPQ